MDSKSQTTQIFNHRLRQLRRTRAVRRYTKGKGESFLARKAGALAAEKLMDINRRFERAALIGLPAFCEALREGLPDDKIPLDIRDFENWPESLPHSVDLIISGLVLQSRNDILETLSAARRALKPDGLFLSGILGGESLLGLRRACFALDQTAQGGALPRIAPMIEMQQAGSLLSMAGLAQPVIDRDHIRVNYGTLKTMIADLRDIGETNCLSAAQWNYSGRDFLSGLESHYLDKSDDGKFKVLFDLIWISGWAPHESQQKPLKPGSAKARLSDALRSIREE